MTKLNDIEIRSVTTPLAVGDVAPDSQTVTFSGYAVLYNTPSVQLSAGEVNFNEVIAPGAFNAQLADNPDYIRLLIEHCNLPLARTGSGTLTLRSDSTGLFFEAVCDATDPDVLRVIPKIKRADIPGMSFGFTSVGDDGDSWAIVNGQVIRTVNVGMLYEVSIVGYPAYSDTNIAMRSIDKAKAMLKPAVVRSAEDDLDVARCRLQLASL